MSKNGRTTMPNNRHARGTGMKLGHKVACWGCGGLQPTVGGSIALHRHPYGEGFCVGSGGSPATRGR